MSTKESGTAVAVADLYSLKRLVFQKQKISFGS